MQGAYCYLFKVSEYKTNSDIYKNNLLFSKTVKKSQNSIWLLKWCPHSLPLFCKSLKANLDKIKISPLTSSKFEHGILLIICNCGKES